MLNYSVAEIRILSLLVQNYTYYFYFKSFLFQFCCKSYAIVFVVLAHFGSYFSEILKIIYYFCHRNKLANESN